jgi:hypothetical protein
MSSVFERVRQAERSSRAEAETAYRELVRAAAEDKAPDPDEILDALAATGRTSADFERDTDEMLRRIELRAKIDGLPKLDNEIAKLEADLKAATDKFEALRRQHEEKMSPMRFRLARLRTQRGEDAAAEAELVRGCSGERRARYDDLKAAQAEAYRKQVTARRLFEDAKTSLEVAEGRAEKSPELYADDVKALRVGLEKRRQQLDAANAEYADLERQMNEVAAAMARP